MKEKILRIHEKTKEFASKIKDGAANMKPIHTYKHAPKIRSVVNFVIVAVVLVVAIAELVLGIMLYGFKSETKFVQDAVKFIPMPVVFSSHGVVTASSYFEEKNYITHFYTSTGEQNIDNSALSLQILSQLSENNIIADEAIKYKLSVSNKDVNDAYQSIVDQNGGNESVEKVLNDLYGLDVAQFKKLIRSQLLRDKFNNDMIERVTVRHILIRVDENATQEQIDAAKAKVDDVVKQIAGGLDFAEAATKYSEDVGSNTNGGLLDPFARGDMVTEFEDVAFTQPIGVVSEPFRTSFGWHILKVESKTGIIDESFDSWLSGLKNKSIIVNLF
ncbi:MAG: peptidylprolyl isomerase [Patescibacteria group bacterium]